MPVINTARAQLRVLREQNDVPADMIAAIEQHLDGEQEIAEARYRSDAEREHVSALRARTVERINAVLDAIPRESRAWLDGERQKLQAAPTPYVLSAADTLVLQGGTPADLQSLVERSDFDPTVTRAVELRLAALHRQHPNQLTDAAFSALVRLRSPRSTPDRGARLRDLELAASRREVIRREQVIAAAGIAGIQQYELSRAAKRAALNHTQ